MRGIHEHGSKLQPGFLKEPINMEVYMDGISKGNDNKEVGDQFGRGGGWQLTEGTAETNAVITKFGEDQKKSGKGKQRTWEGSPTRGFYIVETPDDSPGREGKGEC